MGSNKGKGALLILLFVLVFGTAIWAAYARYAGTGGSSTDGGGSLLPNFSLNDGPPTEAAMLTGLPVEPDKAKRRPLAVMIENHPDARPQAGLEKADVVFEAIVEGGITRFMAVFGSQDADKIGPIRSARPFYVAWAAGLHALYTHAGGSQGALALIPTVSEIVDLPHAAAYFQRDPKPGIASEHTLFSSTKQLYDFAAEKEAKLEADIKDWKFDHGVKLDKRPVSAKVTIPFSTNTYQADWDYERDSNNYKRSLAGSAHVDKVSGDQITASNVVVIQVTRSFDSKANQGKGEFSMGTEGSGKAQIFHNGAFIEGEWKKPKRDEMIRFYDSTGKELEMVEGKTWIAVIPPDITVTHEEKAAATGSNEKKETE